MKELDFQILGEMRLVGTLLHRYHQKQIAERDSGCPFEDMSRGQGKIIGLLHMQPQMRVRDLSMVLGIRQQSMNELLKKLEKKGFIERVPSEEDRRVSLVRLTEAGQDIKPPEGNLDELFSPFTEDEMNEISILLVKMIDRLQELLEEDYDEEMQAWMEDARERYGEEKFALMMQLHHQAACIHQKEHKG